MPEKTKGYIDARGDGRVVLYRREHLKKPKWQARISVPGAKGYKIVSTGLTDFDEAKRFALNLYEKLSIQVMSGGQLNTKTFKQIYEEWKAHASTHGRTRRDGSWDNDRCARARFYFPIADQNTSRDTGKTVVAGIYVGVALKGLAEIVVTLPTSNELQGLYGKFLCGCIK